MERTASYDYHHSFLLAHAIPAEPLRCWRNAVLAVGLFPRLFAGGAYAEGWGRRHQMTRIFLKHEFSCSMQHLFKKERCSP